MLFLREVSRLIELAAIANLFELFMIEEERRHDIASILSYNM